MPNKKQMRDGSNKILQTRLRNDKRGRQRWARGPAAAGAGARTSRRAFIGCGSLPSRCANESAFGV